MYTYRLYTYDTLGNAEDGYNVNDVHGGWVITTCVEPLEHGDDVLVALAAYTERSVSDIEVDYGASYGVERFELVAKEDGKPLGYVEGVQS